MSMTIKKDDFITTLERVQGGLSPKPILEQSNCFVFKDGMVKTFNGSVACGAPSLLSKDFVGVVPAFPLMSVLRLLDDDELTVEVSKSKMVFVGEHRKKQVKINRSTEVLLPVDKVGKPKDWKDLPEGFTEAVGRVQAFTGKDVSKFETTCVHLHPKYVEAFNNQQVMRHRMKLPLREEVLASGGAIKHVSALDVTQFAETESWIHFRNPDDLYIACRRFVRDYPNLDQMLAVTGTKTPMPKGLNAATKRAEVFSAENSDHNYLKVTLKDNRVIVESAGVSGGYWERRKAAYQGKPVSFLITPELLADLSLKYDECEISAERLKISDDTFTYVTCLGLVEEQEES